MRIRGTIHMIELDHKIIGIKTYKKIKFFYFQNAQMNTFKRYLYQGNWIDLEYDDSRTVRKGAYSAYVISYLYRIEALGRNDHVIYYDKLMINKQLNRFLNSLNNTMFLDLEMTMPSYKFRGKGFKTEMIQAGLVIVDHKGNELYRYSRYVKPKLTNHLTKRVEDFLGITSEGFYNEAIEYVDFYNDFKEILKKYNPTIVVFGRNDILVLNESYEINGVKSLRYKTRFVNLCQLIKSYYELRNDPGLFKLYKLYYGLDDVQVHDAFDDCEVTKDVFLAFRKDTEDKTKASIIRKELD